MGIQFNGNSKYDGNSEEGKTISSGRWDLMGQRDSELLLRGWGFGEEMSMLDAPVEKYVLDLCCLI